jgi:iron complex transport system permease protein
MIRVTRRQAVGLLVLLGLAGLCATLRLLVYRQLDGGLLFAWPEPDVARFRWTAVTVAGTVGAALAVSGVLLQALLRNPLASPFILGVSSGAALGVMTAAYAGHVLGRALFPGAANALPALVGAMATLAVVFLLGQRRGWLDPVSLVLIGVVVSAICAALIMFLHHLVPLGLRGDLLRWMAGSIPQHVGGMTLGAAIAVTAGGVGVGMAMGRAMDAATLADDEARSVGLSIGPLRLALFTVAGALAALAVTLAGPIGFVGLVAPHAARMLIGPRHTLLVPGAALAGITLLVAGDVASQIVSVGGGRVPVGVFTALIGGPAFIWLLRSGRGQA